VLATFYYYRHSHDIDNNNDNNDNNNNNDNNDNNNNNDDNNKIAYNFVQQWIEYIFCNDLVSSLCCCKTDDDENITHLLSTSNLYYTKFMYDKLMSQYSAEFVKLLKETNRYKFNGLQTSTFVSNTHYVVSWLCDRYKTLYVNNDHHNELYDIMDVFAATHHIGGNMLHFLARNAKINCGTKTLKHLLDSTIKTFDDTNQNFLQQLLQSRIPACNETPLDTLRITMNKK